MKNGRMNRLYRNYIKRALDIILSLLAIIVLSPIMLVIALLVRCILGSPVIFKQERPGLNEKIFVMYKFRTMKEMYDKDGKLLADSARMTKFGKFLRDTSLDELPELFNILIGDMSIVGPRPQLVKDMVFMTDEQRTRHSVRQGLTGLAQINGRNNISWEDKINYDLEYIKNCSFCLDVKIIFKTVFKVLKKEDVVTDGLDTSEDLGDYLLRIGAIDEEDYLDRLKGVM